MGSFSFFSFTIASSIFSAINFVFFCLLILFVVFSAAFINFSSVGFAMIFSIFSGSLGSALPTHSPFFFSVFREISIIFVKLVSVLTVRLISSLHPSIVCVFGSIYGWCHGTKMIWVDAISNPANMVNNKPVWNLSLKNRIYKSMSTSSFSVNGNSSIPCSTINATSPKPAGFGFIYFFTKYFIKFHTVCNIVDELLTSLNINLDYVKTTEVAIA